jgi:hypothetical protein
MKGGGGNRTRDSKPVTMDYLAHFLQTGAAENSFET